MVKLAAIARGIWDGLKAGFREIGRIGDYWPWRP